MHRIILIERYGLSDFSKPYMVKRRKIPEESVGPILDNYRGFEGKVVLFFIYQENTYDLKEIINSCNELKNLGNCDILHLISDSEIVPSFLYETSIKLGYDVGVCEEETVFSSIFHEVLFERIDALKPYKNFLNDNLLFQDRTLATTYLNLHNKLAAEGKGVEDYMEMTIYEIWKHKDLGNQLGI